MKTNFSKQFEIQLIGYSFQNTFELLLVEYLYSIIHPTFSNYLECQACHMQAWVKYVIVFVFEIVVF